MAGETLTLHTSASKLGNDMGMSPDHSVGAGRFATRPIKLSGLPFGENLSITGTIESAINLVEVDGKNVAVSELRLAGELSDGRIIFLAVGTDNVSVPDHDVEGDEERQRNTLERMLVADGTLESTTMQPGVPIDLAQHVSPRVTEDGRRGLDMWPLPTREGLDEISEAETTALRRDMARLFDEVLARRVTDRRNAEKWRDPSIMPLA